MSDPRLNSIHLVPDRREEYRRSREALLHACGDRTLAGERLPEGTPFEPPTLIPSSDREPAGVVRFWLQDREFIYPLKVGLNTIGRSQDNDIVLEDSFISRRHCAILVHTNDACELHDTASKNGTYLNGRQIPGPSRLSPGDEIRLCDKHLMFFSKDSPSPPPHPEKTQME
jgi:hypothetical protein